MAPSETAAEVRATGATPCGTAGHHRRSRLRRRRRLLGEELGGIDVFVNNAGTGGSALFLDLSLEQWRTTVATDLDGAFVVYPAGGAADGRRGRGWAADRGDERARAAAARGVRAYDAAKHGLGGLMKTLRWNSGEHGITANAVAPGEIATPMTGQDRPGSARGHTGRAYRWGGPASPGDRGGDCFSRLACGSYVTGASWPVDGGMLQMGPQAGSHLTSDDWRMGV